MSDRELLKMALEALEYYRSGEDYRSTPAGEAIIALRTALAAPRPKPVADPFNCPCPKCGRNDYGLYGQCLRCSAQPAPPAAAPEPEPEPEKRHPGYIIGNHWLETAYERLCAGEAEDAILEDYELVREPRLRALRRNAERYEWVLGWLVRSGLLSCEACRIDSPASYGNWWILRKPRSIDSGSFVAFGADLKAAIDAAMEAKP